MNKPREWYAISAEENGVKITGMNTNSYVDTVFAKYTEFKVIEKSAYDELIIKNEELMAAGRVLLASEAQTVSEARSTVAELVEVFKLICDISNDTLVVRVAREAIEKHGGGR